MIVIKVEVLNVIKLIQVWEAGKAGILLATRGKPLSLNYTTSEDLSYSHWI